MDVRSRLIPTSVPEHPEGVVLVLHGGGNRGADMAVSPTQLSVMRMVPIAHRVARAGRRRPAVFRLLNSTRGWDDSHTPVEDTAWAIEQVTARFGADIPVGLVGHSLGGRAAVLSAGHPSVVGVVALAAFVFPQDGLVDAAGRSVLFVHGTDDRIAPIARAEAAARALSRTADVEFIRVEGGKHAMLREHGRFSGPAAEFVTRSVLGAQRPAG